MHYIALYEKEIGNGRGGTQSVGINMAKGHFLLCRQKKGIITFVLFHDSIDI